jgi:L-threonylcarbamoyladenylate synthase
VAAPSANEFMRISPTTAEHVRRGLADSGVFVLDGGPARVGVESTVLSLAGGRGLLLRPGAVLKAEIEAVLGQPVDEASPAAANEPHAAPGMHDRHYSPRAPLYLFQHAFAKPGQGLVLTVEELGADPAIYARRIYAALHEADQAGAEWIAVEEPPDRPEWAAVRDRLRRASVR